jgi:hypothetical protein
MTMRTFENGAWKTRWTSQLVLSYCAFRRDKETRPRDDAMDPEAQVCVGSLALSS